VLGAVHPTVVRVRDAEAALVGGRPGGNDWTARVARAVETVRAFVQPITDVRATREWRRYVSGVLVRRSLEQLADPQSSRRPPQLEDGPSYRLGMQKGVTT
jgi:carbon-monoxide dehydrogenase medium subunit